MFMPFAACGRDQVGRVSGEEDAAVLHRLADAHAMVEDVALDQLASLQRRPTCRGKAVLQLGPDPLVGPVVESVVGGTSSMKRVIVAERCIWPAKPRRCSP